MVSVDRTVSRRCLCTVLLLPRAGSGGTRKPKFGKTEKQVDGTRAFASFVLFCNFFFVDFVLFFLTFRCKYDKIQDVVQGIRVNRPGAAFRQLGSV